MSRRAPRARGCRAAGAGAVIAAALLAGSITLPVGHAEPAPELSRAMDLYQAAQAAMKDRRFDEAVRDYGAAYELSKDPALLFKIGRANQEAGKCDVAVIYYARYLHEGNPSEPFATATKERITACGGDVRNLPGSAPAAPPKPGTSSGSSGTAAPVGLGSGPAAGAGSDAGTAAGSAAGSAEVMAGSGNGSALPALAPSNRHKVAWILTGGAIALVTLGGVLGYAASSSENDVRDLYTGFAGQPPTFDAQTKQEYDDLIDQGHRYEHLSWASFGVAGAMAVGAAILFVTGGRHESAQPARVTPIVTTSTAGVAVTF